MMTALAPPNCVCPALLFGNERKGHTVKEAGGGFMGCVCVLLESQK